MVLTPLLILSGMGEMTAISEEGVLNETGIDPGCGGGRLLGYLLFYCQINT